MLFTLTLENVFDTIFHNILTDCSEMGVWRSGRLRDVTER